MQVPSRPLSTAAVAPMELAAGDGRPPEQGRRSPSESHLMFLTKKKPPGSHRLANELLIVLALAL